MNPSIEITRLIFDKISRNSIKQIRPIADSLFLPWFTQVIIDRDNQVGILSSIFLQHLIYVLVQTAHVWRVCTGGVIIIVLQRHPILIRDITMQSEHGGFALEFDGCTVPCSSIFT